MQTIDDQRPALQAQRQVSLSLAQIVMLLFFLMCAVVFTTVYFRMTTEYGLATLNAMADFTASRPFQARVLLPAIVHGITALVPTAPVAETYFVLTVLVVFFLLFGFHRLIALDAPPATAAAGAFLILYPLFWNYPVLGLYQYPSDLAAVSLFVWGLVAIRTDRHGALYVILALATVNRETSCFLVMAYVLQTWNRLPRRTVLLHAAAMTMIWLGIKLALAWTFRNNPGALFEVHLLNNLRGLSSIHASGWVRCLCSFGLLWIFIPLGWDAVPSAIRRTLWIIPPFVAGMAVVGNVWEVRIYTELVPVLTAASLPGLMRVARILSWDPPAKPGAVT